MSPPSRNEACRPKGLQTALAYAEKQPHITYPNLKLLEIAGLRRIQQALVDFVVDWLHV
jgi:hypothetical protein